MCTLRVGDASPERHLSPQARLSVRAAFCLSVPLVYGALSTQRSFATLVALGALWGISQDGLDRWRIRSSRMLGVALTAPLGIIIGSEFMTLVHSSWAFVTVVGLVAVAAGVIEASLWSTAGMYLLLGAIIGGGLGFAGRTWPAALLICAGVLWVYVVASLTDRRSRVLDQRATLFHAYRALANLLEGLATTRAEELRARAVALLDATQDVIGTEVPDTHDHESIALYQCFVVALQFGELSSYLASKRQPADPAVGDALRAIGAAIRYGTAGDGLAEIERQSALVGASGDAGARHVAAALRYPAPTALSRVEPFRKTISRLPMVERLRFAFMLAGAIVVATIVARTLEGPKGYWLPMSVAFILRPDLGPVMRRAVARTIGTLAGVAIAALVALSGNSEVLLIALSCAMAAAVPWAAQRSHALTVMVFTPIVFVFIAVVGSDQNLFGARIVDTALAALIVLTIDYVFWLHAPSLRPRQLVEVARRATVRYQEASADSDLLVRHSLRRNALRAVTRARSSIDQADSEPHLFSSVDGTLRPQLDQLVTLIDQHTQQLVEAG